MNSYFKKERPGFSGLNHVLIAIGLFLILLLVPIEPFSSFLQNMIAVPVMGVMCFLTICGAALLPDIDNDKKDGGSAASWDLGLLGTILSSIMITISSVTTSIFHGKKDMKPNTQHRFFWHTLLVPLTGFLLIYFFVPSGTGMAISRFENVNIDTFPFSTVFVLFFVGISIYVGSMILLKKASKVLPIRVQASLISLVLMVLSMAVSLFVSSEYNLKMLGYCVCLGYLFHLIGDLFADSGIPLLFPLTGVFGKFWMRIHLLPKALTVKTGSTLESLLKVVFFVIDCALAFIFFTTTNPFHI